MEREKSMTTMIPIPSVYSIRPSVDATVGLAFSHTCGSVDCTHPYKNLASYYFDSPHPLFQTTSYLKEVPDTYVCNIALRTATRTVLHLSAACSFYKG